MKILTKFHEIPTRTVNFAIELSSSAVGLSFNDGSICVMRARHVYDDVVIDLSDYIEDHEQFVLGVIDREELDRRERENDERFNVRSREQKVALYNALKKELGIV